MNTCTKLIDETVNLNVSAEGGVCGVDSISGDSYGCEDPYYCSMKTNKCVTLDDLISNNEKHDNNYLCSRPLNFDKIDINVLTRSNNTNALLEYMAAVANSAKTPTKPRASISATFSDQNSSEACNNECKGKDKCYSLYNASLKKCVVTEDKTIVDFLKEENCKWDKTCKTYSLNVCLTDAKYESVKRALKTLDVPMFEQDNKVK